MEPDESTLRAPSRTGAIVGLALVLAAAIAVVSTRWLPGLVPLDTLASLLGREPGGRDTAALAEVLWVVVRIPVLVALVAGIVLVVVALVRDWRGGTATRITTVGLATGVVVGVVALVVAVIGPGSSGDGGGLFDGGADLPVAVDVVISEIVSSNGSVASDEDGDWSDYIELHNPTAQAVSLAGHFLSDDDGAAGWRLPEVTIGPGEHLLVWASGKDRGDAAAGLHTDFAISKDGEPVRLVAPDGETDVDRIAPVALPRDVSWGRDPAAGDRQCYFAEATPGETNVERCFDDLDLGAPTLSAPSGFYDDPFGLEIAADDDVRVFYTLDGSYPDPETNPERTLVYDGPLRVVDRTPEPERLARINPMVPEEGGGPAASLPAFDEPIDKATVIRARTPHSAETVATYFVGPDLVREGLPVVSLVLDEKFLFDHELGIYVSGKIYEDYLASDAFAEDLPVAEWPANFNQRGRDWERPPPGEHHRAVVFEHCAPGGVCDYQRQIGLRVHGGATRQLPLKSLRLYAREDYGERTFTYPFFADRAPVGQRRLLLRNSGNDQGRTMIMGVYLQGLMAGFHADTQASQPAVVFINGEYWGIHNFRERYDEDYLALYYDADPDTVVAYEDGLFFNDHGRALLEFLVASDPASPETLARVEREVDLDSWIDFLIAHTYVGNPDWPGRNERLWRQPDGPHALGEGPLDGRWRWQIVDVDQMGGGINVYEVDYDMFATRLAATDDISVHGGAPVMFNRLMANAAVADRFVTRYADVLNTHFRPSRAAAALAADAAEIADEVPEHMARYAAFEGEFAFTIEFWENQLAELEAFMVQRPVAVRDQLADRFGLGAPVPVTVQTDPAEGAVQLNTVRIDAATPGVADPQSWTGVYFDGTTITVEALPWAGHRFVGWQGLPEGQGLDVSASRVELTLDGPLELTAEFAPA
ncbi:MAG: CotH kinase family protein [Nitriliruptoraceae bacterium]